MDGRLLRLIALPLLAAVVAGVSAFCVLRRPQEAREPSAPVAHEAEAGSRSPLPPAVPQNALLPDASAERAAPGSPAPARSALSPPLQQYTRGVQLQNLLQLLKHSIARKDEKLVREYQSKLRKEGLDAVPLLEAERDAAQDPILRQVLIEIVGAGGK